MNTEIKRHIDAARQVLVGVVPNPASQIDQITNALIYKFMDDMDQAAMRQGDEAAFFTGGLARYAWTRLMDPRLGSQEKMNLYSEALAKFSQAEQLPELFRGIFKSAFLPYRSPEVLDLFLKEISYFDYSHPEELGNAYEYLLSIMSAQGDAGQFRTPRHIIDFMVDVANPTKDDKILDPACGTGGFLVKSYQHILEQFNQKDAHGNAPKPITPDERKKLMTNFEGYDIDPTMARIAQVNMYLHQFKNPKIYQYDTLSQDERWGDKFDVILANPPFMSPKGGIRPHSKFSIQSTRSEVLFVDYIMNHLRPKGRAAVIVPEGIIFQSGTAHKQLRKNLVEDGLYCVASLPSGVFAPYSGVKTSILFFDNDLAKRAEEILFVKIQNEGFDLGATKRPIAKNDLPQALEIINFWKVGKKSESNLALYVAKSKIADSPAGASAKAGNGDYNLSADRYRAMVDYSNAKWPMVELGEVCELYRGVVYSKLDEVSNNGYKILRANNISLDDKLILDDIKLISKDLTLKETQKLKAGDIFICLASGSKDHIGKVAYINENTDFYFGGFMGAIRIKNKTVISTYLFNHLKDQKFNDFLGQEISGANINNLNFGILSRYKIPLPPLEIQEQIVAELDSYQKIIDGAKQIAQNWKPKIDIDPKWEKVRLGNVCDVRDGTHDSPNQVQEGYPLVTSKNIKDGQLDFSNISYISEEDFKKVSQRSYVDVGDIIMPMIGTIGGACLIKSKEREFAIKNVALFKKSERIIPEYLLNILDSDLVITMFENKSAGATQKFVSLGVLRGLEIPIPPLVIQKQIVEEIERERGLVEAAKKLIAMYEQKTKDVLARLWSE